MRRTKSLIAILTVAAAITTIPAATSAPPPPSPWFQSGWNQSRTANNPQESVLTAANVAHLHRVWSVPVASEGLTLTLVDSANGSAFFEGGADNHLYAVNTTTGASNWNFSTPGCSEVLSPPAIHLGVVVQSSQACQSGPSYLSGYDVSTGHKLWTRRPLFSQAVPITENGRVYTEAPFPHSNKVQISAVDVKTGAVVWSVTRGPAFGIDSFQLAADATHLYLSSPTYTQALNPANGVVDWIRKVAGGQQILVSSGHVVVAGIGVLTSFSASGIKQWQTRPAFNFMSATATELVITDFTGTVEGLTLTTGHATWATTVSDAGSTFGQPAIAGGVVYVGMDTGHGAAVYALRDGTGEELWSDTFGTDDAPLVSVAAGTLFVSTNGTGITALRP